MKLDNIEKIVDYFFFADSEFVKGIGADQSKLPDRGEWINKLESELQKPYINKEIFISFGYSIIKQLVTPTLQILNLEN